MKLGLCSIAALDQPLSEVIRLAAAAGADGLEVTARPPHVLPDAGRETLCALADEIRAAGLAVLAYGSYLGHGDVEPRREVERTAALGTRLLRVWAPLCPGEPDAGFARTVALLARTCDLAQCEGIDVVVERHIGSFADTVERTVRLIEAVNRENFGLNYQACDFLEPSAVPLQTEDARRLAPHSRYVHLKNYILDPDHGRLVHGGSLAEGVLDYTSLLGTLLDAGYSGPMSVEFLSAEALPAEERLAHDLRFVRETIAATGEPVR